MLQTSRALSRSSSLTSKINNIAIYKHTPENITIKFSYFGDLIFLQSWPMFLQKYSDSNVKRFAKICPWKLLMSQATDVILRQFLTIRNNFWFKLRTVHRPKFLNPQGFVTSFCFFRHLPDELRNLPPLDRLTEPVWNRERGPCDSWPPPLLLPPNYCFGALPSISLALFRRWLFYFIRKF